jgi:anti-sigma regulatory factor (Ser/Thr protein kinase)
MSRLISGGAQRCLQVVDLSQVGECRRTAQRIAAAWNLGETSIGRVGIVATELATNLVRHGGGGELLVQPLQYGEHTDVELLAIDRGPGMEVERCMRDGYSTAGSPGTGLGAVRRLSAVFGAYSQRDDSRRDDSQRAHGTVVLSRISRSDTRDTLRPNGGIQFGAVCVPLAGEVECGDTWSVAEDEERVATLVIDGLGHGPLAAVAAQVAVDAFRGNPLAAPQDTMRELHRRLNATRGAAAACALLDVETSQLTYAGVGNIGGTLLHAGTRTGLPSHNGTLGLSLPRAQQFVYAWPPDSIVVMHSDGVSARWNLAAYPGIAKLHPALIAGMLYRDLARQRDDATIVVTSRLQ